MASIKKTVWSRLGGWLCLSALLVCVCTKVPDHCSDHVQFDPGREFCFGDEKFSKCGGNKFDPPTQGCSEDGSTVLTKCGDGTLPPCDDEKHTHEWGGWRTTTPASCEAPGEETNTCRICGDIITRDIEQLSGEACDPDHEHVYGEPEVIDATCYSPGQIRRRCECGDVLVEEIPQLTGDDCHVHVYEWVVVRLATCTEEGLRERKCACGDVAENETIAKLTGGDCGVGSGEFCFFGPNDCPEIGGGDPRVATPVDCRRGSRGAVVTDCANSGMVLCLWNANDICMPMEPNIMDMSNRDSLGRIMTQGEVCQAYGRIVESCEGFPPPDPSQLRYCYWKNLTGCNSILPNNYGNETMTQLEMCEGQKWGELLPLGQTCMNYIPQGLSVSDRVFCDGGNRGCTVHFDGGFHCGEVGGTIVPSCP